MSKQGIQRASKALAKPFWAASIHPRMLRAVEALSAEPDTSEAAQSSHSAGRTQPRRPEYQWLPQVEDYLGEGWDKERRNLPASQGQTPAPQRRGISKPVCQSVKVV